MVIPWSYLYRLKEGSTMPKLIENLRRVLREPGYLKVLLFQGSNESQKSSGPRDGAPRGLVLLHVTATTAEADMLRQVLTEAGFHMEYVAGAATGIFGTTGNNSIYVQSAEFDQADAFLKEFLAAEPLPEE